MADARRPRTARADVQRAAVAPKVLPHDASYWETRSSGDRQEFLKDVNEKYTALLTEFANHANICVTHFEQYVKYHTWWRRILIVATGGLAIVNVLIAHGSGGSKWAAATIAWIAVIAAIYAAILAILQNLESFHHFPQRVQAFRETRETYLDAARDFEMQWEVHVRALSDSSMACMNAEILYQELVGKDRQIRVQVKEATQIEARGAAKQAR